MEGLGFRDVNSFILVLLSKQCWCILKDPLSLTSRVLKQKYFKKEEFMQAKLGHRPSFVWRSLLVGRELLSARLIWRIENGRTTKIWKDQWIPKPFSNRIQSPMHMLKEQAIVTELIHEDYLC